MANQSAAARQAAEALAALHDPGKSEDERLVLATTAVITFVAALGVSGGTNLVMILTKDPIIKEHKPTLAFASAWIGDGILLPIINVLMMMALRRWGTRVGRRNTGVALLGGMGIMSAFQYVQATQAMTNYTMPEPWKWTWLGYYHMLYMGSQFAFMLFYFLALYQAWQAGKVTTAQKQHLAAIAGMILLFAGLLQLDYS
ncbi:MAG TPA: hypothetical protein VM536_22025 [Chloroflexia bacterium]|nr:hypothetical protein [Chloroflexia bacterium]